jgi:Cu-Zn family superoxide dismutase
MTKWKALGLAMVAVAAMIVALSGANRVVAQDATPEASPIVGPSAVSMVLQDANGEDVGTATFAEGADGVVTVIVEVQGLAEGEHGLHVHETGLCEPPFESAGGHFNPTGAMHGGPPTVEGGQLSAASPVAEHMGHAGDLGNIMVNADGTGTATVQTDRFTLSEGEFSLQDMDGSAIVVHAGVDDLTTDPSGNSGDRIACGVVFAPMGGTPVAGS